MKTYATYWRGAALAGGDGGGGSCRINTFSSGLTSFRRCRISYSWPDGLSLKRPIRARCSSILRARSALVFSYSRIRRRFSISRGNTLRPLQRNKCITASNNSAAAPANLVKDDFIAACQEDNGNIGFEILFHIFHL